MFNVRTTNHTCIYMQFREENCLFQLSEMLKKHLFFFEGSKNVRGLCCPCIA
jgi:hypothetical protein